MWCLEQPQTCSDGSGRYSEWESDTLGKDLKVGAKPGQRSPSSTALRQSRRGAGGTRVTIFPRTVRLRFRLITGLLHHGDAGTPPVGFMAPN